MSGLEDQLSAIITSTISDAWSGKAALRFKIGITVVKIERLFGPSETLGEGVVASV